MNRALPAPAAAPSASAESPAHLRGRGVDAFEAQRYREARRLMETAAAAGDGIAQFYLGVMHWRGLGGFKPDPQAAGPLFQAAAAEAFPPAQVNLGLALLHGCGMAPDAAAAVRLFETAAQAGHPDGLFHLGVCFGVGRGVEANLARAFALFEQAAHLGHGGAMRAYGAALADGRGCAANVIEGLAWLYAAAAAGAEESAVKHARFLAERLTARDISRAHRRGRVLARQLRRASGPLFDGRPRPVALPPGAAAALVDNRPRA